jgi:hypothetical protein
VSKPHEPADADIELSAEITAAELHFREQPSTRVDFFADPDSESGSGSDRTNLPRYVTEGATYRNIHVDYRLATRLTDPDI